MAIKNVFQRPFFCIGVALIVAPFQADATYFPLSYQPASIPELDTRSCCYCGFVVSSFFETHLISKRTGILVPFKILWSDVRLMAFLSTSIDRGTPSFCFYQRPIAQRNDASKQRQLPRGSVFCCCASKHRTKWAAL